MNTNDGSMPPAARFFANMIPATVGMLLTSSVVIVDGLFIGRCAGSAALAGVNLTVPVLYAFMAVAIMIAVGGSSAVSPLLGAGRPGEAARIRTASLAALFAAAAISAAAVFLARRPLTAFLGARGDMAPYTGRYLSVMCLAYPFSMASIGLSVFLRGAGEPMVALRNGLAANAANVALDWFFLARLGLGVSGAAWATVIACALQCALSLGSCLRGGARLGFARPSFRPGELSGILANGSSEFVGQLSVMIFSWAFNRAALALYGTPGVAALTVVGYLSFLESMVVSGCAIGLAPVVGLSWGAGDSAGARAARRTAIAAAALLGAGFFGAALFGGTVLALVWTRNDPEVAALAGAGFSVYALAFLLNGYNYIASAFLTSLQDAAGSAGLALLRGVALPVAFLLALPRLIGPMGLWLSVPAAEAAAFAAALPLSRRGLRKLDAEYVPPARGEGRESGRERGAPEPEGE